jgi:8-oxo-dGTP pyrophosphatase MutT (NUDIX family)/2'-5' RNA ligase
MNLAEDAGYSRAYGPFLPRPARTFTQGAFGPFSPILPVPVDEAPPGALLPDPRRFDYEVGFNLPTPPGQDGYKLASFSVLRQLADLYSVCRSCINRRKDMVLGLEWDIVPTREAAKAYQSDNSAMKDFGERRAKAVKFFKKPDPNYFTYDSFMSALLEEVFVFDALSILLKPKRARGLKRGLLGSDLDCIELITGPSIRPLIDLSGGYPRPPAPAFQQYLKGIPRSDLQAMWDMRDIEEAGLKGYEGPAFSADQLMYLPTTPRAFTPYGFSATEMALIVILTGLRKQAYQAQYYDEGTVPSVYISPGDVNITPTQIRELQNALNAFAGDQAWHHRIIVLPPGAHVMPMRATDLADQFDEIIMNQVAMVFDVDPMSLGIIPQVSTTVSPFAAKEMAQASRTVHDRTSMKPLLKFLVSISESILHRVCGQDDMKFTFAGLDEAQDQAAQTDLLVKQFQNGFISIDEAREELQRTAWGLDETSGPLIMTQNGPVPLNQIIQMMQQQMQPMQSGQNAPANSAGSATVSHQPRAVHHPPSSRPVGTHNPRLGLPSGAPAGAELPPEGPGRRVSDTPAHTAARAHSAAGSAGRKAAGTGVAERPSARAVTAELEALARHLRRGRNIAGWKPDYLSGQVMAVIAEDLTKGLSVDEVIREALTVALPASEYEWVSKAPAPQDPQSPQQNQTPAQQQAQALAQKYATRIRAVFASVAKAAASLIRQWLTGALTVTATALAAMIAALLAKRLGPVLRSLWRDAWAAGRRSAADVLGTAPSGSDEMAFNAWADSHGRDWLEQIVTTHEDDVTAGLAASARAGEDAQTIASKLEDWLDAAGRSVLIAVDQVQRALNAAVMAVARKLGVVQKRNVTAGDDRVCAKCRANAAVGWLNFTEPYPSGQLEGPFHPRCRCHQDLRVQLNASAQKSAGRRYVDLPGQEWWPADSYPSGPAMGGGGRMLPAHNADGIEEYIPGGVPGMTAGGEPPRWDGDEADHVVASSPQTVSAGRGDVQTRGGGTVSGPYADFSDRTHVHVPDGHDDAQWPGERAVGPVAGRSWPQQGYMGGYWPEGGHGTAQAPGGPVAGGTDRGRAPNAWGKASGYSLNPRSGMISLDLPDGLVPDALDPAHVTVVYLGPDVDDGAFALACLRAQQAAAKMPGPLAGVISGLGTFEPSDSSDGKIPAWAGVMLPGAEVLREALADLSASEHRDWHPHVTRAYLEPGEPMPEPLSPVPVTFTHLSVHRGDQVERYPLGAPPATTVKAAAKDDESRLAWLLIRARDGEGRWRYLLQQRDDGTWGMPGGCTHVGEDPYEAAVREVTEEVGDLPPLTPVATFHHMDDPDTQVFVWLCEAPFFRPELNGDTPEETSGTGWFRKKEIGDLDLTPAFRDDWDEGHIDLGRLKSADADVTKDAADLSDPNPVEPAHILSIMRANFPEDSLNWVSRSRWIGPCEVPWERINTADIGSWAASHQPDAVNRFAAEIKAGTGHLNPSILIQRPDDDKCDVVDGHHRALARHQLGKPVLAYIGFVHGKDVEAALETHSAQLHSGEDPQNKSAETPIVSTVHHPLGREGLWHTPDRHVSTMQSLPAYFQNTARALMRDHGMGEQEAIATAINAVKEWAEGRAFGGKVKVTPQVQAAARRALAEWAALRASHDG